MNIAGFIVNASGSCSCTTLARMSGRLVAVTVGWDDRPSCQNADRRVKKSPSKVLRSFFRSDQGNLADLEVGARHAVSAWGQLRLLAFLSVPVTV